MSDFPVSPTGSLLRGWRPSLHWLFQHIRGSQDRDYVTKEDLRAMLKGQVDPKDLDEAFERLDQNSNGEVTEDEFMTGFATFLCEASSFPQEEEESETGLHRTGSFRHGQRRRQAPEYWYETQLGIKPSDSFKRSLKPFSIHNRQGIEELWKSLNDSNPDLIPDFEEFIDEMTDEVQAAQQALKKQKEFSKLEAIQLDEEVERIHNESQTKLQVQTAIIREKANNKLEKQLQEKESELGEIREKLLVLESQVLASRQSQSQIQHQYEESVTEREELLARLSESEQLLRESANTIVSIRQETSQYQNKQKGLVAEQEEAMSQLKSTYSSEITELRDRLHSLQRNQEQMYQPFSYHNNSRNYDEMGMDTPLDLLSPHDAGRVSPSSLLDEIVETEGTVSPLILKDTMIHSTPTQDTCINPVSSDPGNHSVVRHKSLEHLDLALPPTSPITLKPPRSDRIDIKRPRSAQRPSSLFLGEGDTLDLSWPPGNWRIASQEYLAAVASNDITKSHNSILPPISVPVPVPEPEPNSSPDTPLTEMTRLKENQKGRYCKYYNNPEKCKPLEFVESLVLQPNHTFKILVVGNPHVGKSCFLMRLCTNTFTTRYASTIGVDFFSRAIKLNEQIISLQLWDTAGQERFQSVTRAYYRGAQGVILMYDITNEDSFIAVKTWINSIQDNMDELPTALLLVGNKADLDSDKREVLTETGETFAKIYGALFAEASAKSGYNIGNACLLLVDKLISEGGPFEDTGGFPLAPKEKSSCSC